MKKSPFGYSDHGYADFKAAPREPARWLLACSSRTAKSRRGTVYAAANDGMLHAFETDVNNNPYFQTAGIATEHHE